MLNTTFVKSLSVSAIGFMLAGLPGVIFAQDTEAVGFADLSVCKPGLIPVPEALRIAPAGNPDEQNTEIEADEFETEGNIINLRGERAGNTR